MKNDTVNLILNSTKTIEGNKYLNKNSSKKNNLIFNKNSKFNDLPSTKNKNDNKFDCNKSIILNDRIYNLKKNNCIYGKQKDI